MHQINLGAHLVRGYRLPGFPRNDYHRLALLGSPTLGKRLTHTQLYDSLSNSQVKGDTKCCFICRFPVSYNYQIVVDELVLEPG
jgi:hypothetical protein